MAEAVRTLRRGGIAFERSLDLLDGVVMVRQRFAGDDTRVVVTHDAAMRAVVEVRRGRLVIPLVTGDIVAPPRFVLAIPPRSILPLRFEHAEVVSEGTGAPGPLDRHTAPAIEALAAPWRGVGDAVAVTGEVLARLDPDAGVAAPLVRARAVLHAAIGALAPVRVAAEAVGLAPETLARRFAAVYRITPKLYCQRARLFDAAILLFHGASVIDAALRAGFNDLTRFYAQFRRRVGGTPGALARIRKRQDAAARAG